MCRAAKNQLAYGDAAGVEPRDERRDGPRWHEGAGAVYITDRLRHSLCHVGAFMENEFHERGALNTLALHAIESRDVKEVILVVVGKVAFHLRRVHSAIGLGHVDCGIADLRENIDGHPFQREHRAERNRYQGDDNRYRSR